MKKMIILGMLILIIPSVLSYYNINDSFVRSDTKVVQSTPTINYVTTTTLEAKSLTADNRRALWLINISNLSLSYPRIIVGTNLSIPIDDEVFANVSFNISYQYADWTLNQSDVNMTWNNQPNWSSSFQNQTFSNTAGKYNYSVNITQYAKEEYEDGDGLFWIMAMMNHVDSASEHVEQYFSKESPAGRNPFLILETIDNTSTSFNIRDEITRETITTDTFTVEALTSDSSQNITTSNGLISLLLVPNKDYRISYGGEVYAERDYYLTITNNTITNITYDLYSLSTGNSTDVTFQVRDSAGTGLEDSLIKLKRYYVSSNSYITVAESKTNTEGKTSINVDYNDAFYETQTTYGSFTTTTSGARFITTTFYITLSTLLDPFTSSDEYNDVSSTLTFNNVTQTFSYSFNTNDGTAKNGTIKVYSVSGNKQNLQCENSAVSTSATVLCQVNVSNSSLPHIAQTFVNIRGANIRDKMLEVTYGISETARQKFGTSGVFFSVLLAGTLAGLGAMVSPAMAVIMFLVGMGAVMALGLSALAVTTYVIIIIIGILVIIKVKN